MTAFSDIRNTTPRWMDEAPCKDMSDSEEFFPDVWSGALRRRKTPHTPPAICDGCPVANECLKFGTEINAAGWWGGVLLKPDLRAHQERTFQKFYDKDHTDEEIATLSGCSNTTPVRTWRKKNGLPPLASKVPGAGYVNKHGERSCRYGHPSREAGTYGTDGNLICVSCAFGKQRAS